MKIKSIIYLIISTCLLVPAGLKAQSTAAPAPASSPIQGELQALVKQVQVKIQAGKTTEADLAPEIKSLDTLLAGEKGAKTDEAALIDFMKAQLYLEVIKDDEKGAQIIKQIKADYPDTKYGKSADKILDGIAKSAGARKIQKDLATGAVFPDFSESDLDGKPISIASRKGKVVLVDFWATWCGPCRAELPNVIETYKKHHSEGFEIIGVSLDSDRDKLDSFLKQEDGMTWPQYYDGEGWNNKLAVKYGVQSIPFAVLVGPDGKIIGKELRGEELEDAVAKAVAAK
jgi:thiol-disulfide isomerase/thioredoxin